MSEDGLGERLAELRRELEALTRRVEGLEKKQGILPGPADEPTPAAPAGPRADRVSIAATRSAVVCFVLVGALALRVVAQNGGMAPLPGALMGLAWCALLIAAPVLFRRKGFLFEHGVVLQDAGVLLVPLIVLETFHKYQAMSLTAAVLVFSGVGIGGSLLGAFARRQGMACLSLAVQVVAIPALGSADVDPSLRVLSLWVASATAAFLAHRRGWPLLRLLVVVPAALLVLVLAVGSKLRPDLAGQALAPALFGVLGLWSLAMVNHVVRARAMPLREAVFLPLASAWAYGIFVLTLGEEMVAPIGVGVAVALAALAALAAVRSGAGPLGWGFAVAGAALAVLALPMLETTGVALALVGLVVLVAARILSSPAVAVASVLVAVAAAATVLTEGRLTIALAAGRPVVLLGGIALAALEILHAWAIGGARLEGQDSRSRRWLAPVPLVCGFVVLFFTVRAALSTLVGFGEAFMLSESLLLSALSIAGLVLGRRLETKPLLWSGAAGLLVFAARVVLQDLWALQGFSLLVSVIALGSTFVVASFALKRREGRTGAPG